MFKSQNNKCWFKNKKSSRIISKRHLESQVIEILSRRKAKTNEQANTTEHLCLIADFEPKIITKFLSDSYWQNAMQEEINQIEKNKTWELVPRPTDKNVIGGKGIFRNKLNEDGKVIRNKAKFVCKGYAQQEGNYFGETFALVARMESI